MQISSDNHWPIIWWLTNDFGWRISITPAGNEQTLAEHQTASRRWLADPCQVPHLDFNLDFHSTADFVHQPGTESIVNKAILTTTQSFLFYNIWKIWTRNTDHFVTCSKLLFYQYKYGTEWFQRYLLQFLSWLTCIKHALVIMWMISKATGQSCLSQLL